MTALSDGQRNSSTHGRGAKDNSEVIMAQIEIKGKKYKIIDNLNYVHEAGGYVKEVETSTGNKMAIKRRGFPWRFWTINDRLGR